MPDELDLENNQDANGLESVSEGNGENPAWQELYGVLPDSLHSLVKPVLEKWESGTQAKFKQHADSELAYEPYKQFMDGEISPDQIAQALSVAQLIDSDPKAFMAQMQTFFGEEPAVTNNTNTAVEEQDNGFEEQGFDLTTDPNFKKMMEQQDTIAGFLAQKLQSEKEAAEDTQLEADYKSLADKYGEFDEDYVTGLALNDVPLEAAVQKYHAMVANIRSKPAADANLPNILTPGGGLPSEQVNPADMTDVQRKALVMSILAQANTT